MAAHGTTPETAQESCDAIKQLGYTSSGKYWILVAGLAAQVHCDMSVDPAVSRGGSGIKRSEAADSCQVCVGRRAVTVLLNDTSEPVCAAEHPRLLQRQRWPALPLD